MTQLAALIALMDSVAPTAAATLVLKPHPKTGSTLVSMSPDCTVQLHAPALAIAGLQAPIAVDSKTLVGACKNRETALTVSGSEIVVKSGKAYSAKVACSDDVPAIPEGLANLEGEGVTQVALTQDHMLAIKQLLARTKIERTFTGIVDTLVSVRANAKSLTVMNYEPAQVSSVSAKNSSGVPDCFFVLPAAILAKALNLVGPVSLGIDDSCAVFKSKQCLVRVNLPIDTINAIDKQAVVDLVASIKSTDAIKPSLTTTKKSMQGFLDNAESLIQVGGDVVIAPGVGNSVMASVTTVRGEVKEKFSGSVSKGFSIGFSFMRAIVNRTKDGEDLELKTTDAFAVVKSGTALYIASLSES